MTVKHVKHIVMDPPEAQLFTGSEGEFVVERDTYLIRVHDGATPGGWATLTRGAADALYQTIVDFNTTVDDLELSLEAAADEAILALKQSLMIAQGPVIDIATALGSVDTIGNRHLIAGGGTTGIAVGNENLVAEYTDTGWVFSDPPTTGAEVFVQSDSTVRYFNGVAWATTPLDTTFLAAQADIVTLTAALAAKAPLADPTFTGVPAAPTAVTGTDTTQIATTAFVQDALTDFASVSLPGTLATEGTQTLASGMIMKWGHYAGGSSNPTVAFATPFPNACFNVQFTSKGTAADVTDAANNNEVRYTQINTFDENGFSAWCSSERGIEDVFHAYTGVEFYWFAIGH